MASREIGTEKLEVIKQRIQKLLALGTSPNENEAALAVAKAQELLQQYDLSMESVENLQADKRTNIRRGTEAVIRTTQGKPDGWKTSLFEAVAQCHDCVTFYNSTWERTPANKEREIKHGKLIGFGHDVEQVGYELNFLVTEIERLSQGYADDLWQQIRDLERNSGMTHQEAESYYVKQTGRHPLKAKLYFIKGATESVIRNLQDAYYERQHRTNDNPFALVTQKRQAVRDFLYRERYGKTQAEMQAQWDREDAEYEAAHPKSEYKQVVGKAETPAEARKREAREAREQERQEQRWAREQKLIYRETDHQALHHGYEAGRSISTRKGINEAPTQDPTRRID